MSYVLYFKIIRPVLCSLTTTCEFLSFQFPKTKCYIGVAGIECKCSNYLVLCIFCTLVWNTVIIASDWTRKIPIFFFSFWFHYIIHIVVQVLLLYHQILNSNFSRESLAVLELLFQISGCFCTVLLLNFYTFFSTAVSEPNPAGQTFNSIPWETGVVLVPFNIITIMNCQITIQTNFNVTSRLKTGYF